jgi:hypothetical protein
MRESLWALCGIAAGAVLMAAPEKFQSLPPGIVDLLFYGGLVVAITSALLACALAFCDWRAKQQRSKSGISVRMGDRNSVGNIGHTIHGREKDR